MQVQQPSRHLIAGQVALALAEDVGSGDLTASLLPREAYATATVISRERAVVCGRPWFDEVFRQLDGGVRIEWAVSEGEEVAEGTLLCTLKGNSRALLTGERTALNYLQTLSATATLAGEYAKAVSGTGARVLDTRKTLPGLRLQQKYAVACGGGDNHRSGLHDAILIKENHIAAAGSITQALQQAQALNAGVSIEIEVESLAELDEALAAGATRVLLDNFDNAGLREAVALTAGRARLEASGNVSLDSIRAMAETGVNDISVGALTKNLKAVDLSMRFQG
jgi:nicotinate-nucleotide pyrophosphorylase (carboxylating)